MEAEHPLKKLDLQSFDELIELRDLLYETINDALTNEQLEVDVTFKEITVTVDLTSTDFYYGFLYGMSVMFKDE